MTIETDQHGAILALTLDGIAYTPDELREHIARSQSTDALLKMLRDGQAENRRLSRLLAAWQNYGYTMQRVNLALHLAADARRREEREKR